MRILAGFQDYLASALGRFWPVGIGRHKKRNEADSFDVRRLAREMGIGAVTFNADELGSKERSEMMRIYQTVKGVEWAEGKQ